MWANEENITADTYKDCDERSSVFVAVHSGLVASAIGMAMYDPAVDRMRQVAVSPQFRGQNVGKRLVEAVHEDHKQHSKGALRVNAHEASASFYEKCGFERGEVYESNAVQCVKMKTRESLSEVHADAGCDEAEQELTLRDALRALISTPAQLKVKRENKISNSSAARQTRDWHDDAYFALARAEENKYALDGARRLEKVGVSLDSLPPVVHVAGTKGKGSTCAFAESMLRHHGLSTGLFTSPHLIDVRERIRIDGAPVDVPSFTSHFWSVWRDFSATNVSPSRPGFFGFLALVAFRIFAAKGVDVIILEVGLGGRLDATNVIRKPIVCGITRLDYDHTAILGSTLTAIANEKAGILKDGVPAFTISSQEPEAAAALIEAARKRGTKLDTVEPLPADGGHSLGLAGDHQRENAALAVKLVSCALEQIESKKIKAGSMASGLANCQLFGRAQTHRWNDIDFYLDGAHTPKSIACCMNWFKSKKKSKTQKTYLVFNCAHTRDGRALLRQVYDRNLFDAVIFCASYSRPTTERVPTLNDAMGYSCACSKGAESGTWQHVLSGIWNELELQDFNNVTDGACPRCAGTNDSMNAPLIENTKRSFVFANVRDAVSWAVSDVASDSDFDAARVLVTGSILLVGEVLKETEWSSPGLEEGDGVVL